MRCRDLTPTRPRRNKATLGSQFTATGTLPRIGARDINEQGHLVLFAGVRTVPVVRPSVHLSVPSCLEWGD
jgi:hypothetical protein